MMRRWVETWKAAGPELELIRRREIRERDNPRILALLEPAFNHAVRSQPPRHSSGMVEMQAYFAELPGSARIGAGDAGSWADLPCSGGANRD